MMTLIEIGEAFGSRCDIGVMEGNVLDRRIIHLNQANTSFDGCVYFELNCTTGMDDTTDGIKDFVSITYTCPNGSEYSCNDHSYIERISPNSIKITPPMEPYAFPPNDVEVYSDIEIVFVDGARRLRCPERQRTGYSSNGHDSRVCVLDDLDSNL